MAVDFIIRMFTWSADALFRYLAAYSGANLIVTGLYVQRILLWIHSSVVCSDFS